MKSTLTQVKDRTLTVAAAVPIIKSQAEAMSKEWEALTQAMKC
jgi:hypothetical protein